MLERVPVLDSQVIRALVVAGVGVIGNILSFFGVDEALFGSERVQHLADGIATLFTLGGIAWAAWARATKPTPPLTEAAKQATLEAVRVGDLKPAVKQAGFLRPGLAAMLIAVALAAVAGGGLAGCSGTKAAFEAAHTRPEAVLPDTAYVLAEQYRAILKEAADLKQSGRLPAEVVARLQEADRVAKPLVIGDPSAVPPKLGLRQLAETFQAVRNAQTEADLQRAVDDAVLAIANFIRAVDDARRVQ